MFVHSSNVDTFRAKSTGFCHVTLLKIEVSCNVNVFFIPPCSNISENDPNSKT